MLSSPSRTSHFSARFGSTAAGFLILLLSAAGAHAQTCGATPMSIGMGLGGSLTAADCPSTQRSGAYADKFTFSGNSGQQIAITLVGDFDTYLYLIAPGGAVIAFDDNGGGGTSSRIPAGAGYLTLPSSGVYTIEVTSAAAGVTGSYTVGISTPQPVSAWELSTTSVVEGGQAVITVTRNIDVLNSATVNYASSDNSGLNSCSFVTGEASSRCDYPMTVGTLRFAPGEQTKTVQIPIVDDAIVEGTETFTVTFEFSFFGFTFSGSTFVPIIDNDFAPSATNPVDRTAFFVRQHYIDFLGREPDAAGYAGWQNILNNCPPSGRDANGNYCDRIEVSSGFFRSEEFLSRGYFVYRFYPTALGRPPRYAEFVPDMAKVSGFLSAQQLEANKVAFVQEFMSRAEFKNRYDSLATPTAYVDRLLQTAGLQNHPTRQFWINQLTSGAMTRAQVLRALADSAEVYFKFYNEAFVVMQYFGYLRRDPDALYVNWIQTMNQNGGDYRVMINGFMNSIEYRQRFGQ